jgi:hypothetical protein
VPESPRRSSRGASRRHPARLRRVCDGLCPARWDADGTVRQHKAAFLPVAQQCCLTGKAALWYNLSSLAFLGKTGRRRNKGPVLSVACPEPRRRSKGRPRLGRGWSFFWFLPLGRRCREGEVVAWGNYSMGGGKGQGGNGGQRMGDGRWRVDRGASGGCPPAFYREGQSE